MRSSSTARQGAFDDLVLEVRNCRACVGKLPLGPRPVIQVSPSARLLIASQAPGTKVHTAGIPFSDDSGVRLREWMGIEKESFYDASKVAILPMAFCYPGKYAGGDAPPRRECAEFWREPLLQELPHLGLTLLVGTYAQAHALGAGKMTDRVRRFSEYLPKYFPLPHPSWRSQLWARENPWFGDEVLPERKKQVAHVLLEKGK